METRELLIEVGMSALYGLSTPSMIERILDAVEPIIRADERDLIVQVIQMMPIDEVNDPWSMGYDKALLDLEQMIVGSDE